MSLSPARQHRLRIQAEQAAREGGSVRHASGHDLMLLQLAEDRRRLKGVQSTVKKAEIKVELLPKYSAWAEGVLAAGGAQQDDVLMYVMLWRIDAGDYAGALEIGRHALRHGWVMPLGNRNVQTVLAEEMADAAQSAMLAATGFDADLLLQTLELTDGLDMPDQSRARLHKAIGAVLSESNPASYIPFCRFSQTNVYENAEITSKWHHSCFCQRDPLCLLAMYVCQQMTRTQIYNVMR